MARVSKEDQELDLDLDSFEVDPEAEEGAWLDSVPVTPIPNAREVEANFERDEDRVTITAELGDAIITIVSTSDEGGEDAAFLVQTLPQILARVQTELDNQED